MIGILLLRGGPRNGEKFTLPDGAKLVFGRDFTSDVQILDSTLSRTHSEIENEGIGFVVRDLSSTNGTFVNGKRVKEYRLRPGDVVAIGSTKIEVTQLPDGERSAAPYDLSLDPDRLATTSSHRFEADESGFLEAFQREERPENYEKLYKNLKTIYSMSGLLSAVEDLDQLFQIVVDTVVDIFEAERGCLIMHDGHGGYTKFYSPKPATDRDTRWSLSTTILNETLQHGMSALTRDAGLDTRFRSGKSVVLQNIKSVMCVPVESRDEIMGAIYLDTIVAYRTFTEDDLELLAAIGKQAGVAIKREKLTRDKELLFLDTIRAIVAAIEAKDHYTAGHSTRVASYVETLAFALDYGRAFIERLRFTAHLHDVGKIGVPESILNKPGRLEPDEFKIIQTHPVIGAEILSNISNIEDVVKAVRHHHERMDGHGYPDGLAGEEIPLLSRMMLIADTFDAMTSGRAYRKGLSTEEVVEELERHSGTQFDPRLATKFVELLRAGTITPIGRGPRLASA